jgi:hypothetical protein
MGKFEKTGGRSRGKNNNQGNSASLKYLAKCKRMQKRAGENVCFPETIETIKDLASLLDDCKKVKGNCNSAIIGDGENSSPNLLFVYSFIYGLAQCGNILIDELDAFIKELGIKGDYIYVPDLREENLESYDNKNELPQLATNSRLLKEFPEFFDLLNKTINVTLRIEREAIDIGKRRFNTTNQHFSSKTEAVTLPDVLDVDYLDNRLREMKKLVATLCKEYNNIITSPNYIDEFKNKYDKLPTCKDLFSRRKKDLLGELGSDDTGTDE